MHWKEILAIDTFEIKTCGVLRPSDWHVLTLLYQPIMGNKAYSLYMTLWSDLECNLVPKVYSHHHLLVSLQCTLNDLLEERKKLEAIGLLRTYVHQQKDEVRQFVYELCSPVEASDFFQDGVLNVVLYERLGSKLYTDRMNLFLQKKLDRKDLKEITVPFNTVFSPSQSSFVQVYDQMESQDKGNTEFKGYKKGKSVSVFNNFFDFDTFFEGLSKSLVARESFNPPIKELIVKLAYIYQLDIFEMQKAVLSSLDENDQVLEDQLRKNAQLLYQTTTGERVPSIYDEFQKKSSRESRESLKNASKEDRLLYTYQNLSPYEFLTRHAKGAKPSIGDMKIVEAVILEQKLPLEVVNVLLDYVLLKSDKKLSKVYVSKIAAHWARKGIQTAKDAMALAKAEQRQYEEWANKKPMATTRGGKSRKEVIPDWMNEQKNPEDSAVEVLQESFEDERKKLEERLNKYISKQGVQKGEG